MFQKFGRRQDQDNVDVNAFIVNNNFSGDIPFDPALNHSAPSLDIPNDQIIDADYAEDPAPRTRPKLSKILMLGAFGAFAVAGVASIFVSPSAQPIPAPVADAAPPLPAQIQLPVGLDGPAALTTTSNATPILTPPINDSVGTPSNLAAPTNGAPATNPGAIAAPSLASTSSTPTVAAAPQVPAGANPLAAQLAEVERLQGVTPAANTSAVPSPGQSAPAPTPAAPPVIAASAPPKPADVHAPKPASAPVAKPAPAPASAPVAKPQPKPAPATSKPAVPSKPAPAPKTTTPALGANDVSEEGIKRLVTTSPEAFGLQAIQEGSITLEGRRGNGSQRLTAGDRLPSGEQILRIDAQSMIVVTDRSVIRIIH